MVNKFSNIKERVLQIAENKGIAKEKFFQNIGMTYGNFKGRSKGTPLNSNAIADISSIYPDVDLQWLITGKGKMLKDSYAVDSSIQIEDLHNRLVLFINKYVKSNLIDFSKKIDFDPIELGQIVSAVINPSSHFLHKITEHYPEINPAWFFDGSDEMFKKEVRQQETPLFAEDSISYQKVPLYELETTAGLLQLFQASKRPVPIDTISIPNLPKCDGAIYVVGDSMYPLLNSGDIVVYKQVHDLPHDFFWGEMYLIDIELDGDTYITIKYIQQSEIGLDYIKLVSFNSHHSAKDIHISKIRAAAIVKASIRINSMV